MHDKPTRKRWHAVAGMIEVEEDDTPDIASFYPGDFGQGHLERTHEEIWANCRLAAAAPDLLVALEKAVAMYGKPGGPWNVPSEPGTWVSEAKDAIAKARGKS